MLAQTYSATHQGIEGVVIKIESVRQRSLPKIQITGLPGEIVKESRDRVRACLVNLGFETPSSHILVNLSPASARKQGSQFDLGIAISLLVTEGYLKAPHIPRTAFLGELSLEGRVRSVRGLLSLLQSLEECPEVDQILIPRENASEASLVSSTKTKLVDHLVEAIEYLEGKRVLDSALETADSSLSATERPQIWRKSSLDHVLGQPLAKRALQISLAGRHHLLMLGPPGVGKSMLAQCASQLLPPLTPKEFLAVSKNYDAGGVFRAWDRNRPFRAPHHSISGAGMLGGGSANIIPGEVTLAHAGVLFLDELPEFRKDVIEGLREPIQSGQIHLHRIGSFHTLPAQFTLIAAMNPCPCGHSLSSSRRCQCSWEQIKQYRKRISGAILDRIDLGVILSRPQKEDVKSSWLTHTQVASSVREAQAIQRQRLGETILNGDEGIDVSAPYFFLGGEASEWFEELKRVHELSYRALHKILGVSRTIADLDGAETISIGHLREAWGLRCPNLHLLNA